MITVLPLNQLGVLAAYTARSAAIEHVRVDVFEWHGVSAAESQGQWIAAGTQMMS